MIFTVRIYLKIDYIDSKITTLEWLSYTISVNLDNNDPPYNRSNTKYIELSVSYTEYNFKILACLSSLIIFISFSIPSFRNKLNYIPNI